MWLPGIELGLLGLCGKLLYLLNPLADLQVLSSRSQGLGRYPARGRGPGARPHRRVASCKLSCPPAAGERAAAQRASCEAGVSCHVELWPTQQHSVG